MILLLDERQRKELAQYILDSSTETRIENTSLCSKYNWQEQHPFTEFREGDLYICLGMLRYM